MAKFNKRHALGLVEKVLYARRSRNVPREQHAYMKLAAYCERVNVDFSQVLEEGESYLKANSIAANMNGIA